jgi:hypothetical protein
LRNRVRDRRLAQLLASEERNIDNLNEIKTWNEYKGGRAAYDQSRAEDERLTDSQIGALEQRFIAQRTTLRAARKQTLLDTIQALTVQENWGDFRRRERISASEGVLEAQQVTDVQTAFTAKMTSLAATPTATTPTTS